MYAVERNGVHCGALPRIDSLYRRIQEVVRSVVNVNLLYSAG
jgi:hypothetical protein